MLRDESQKCSLICISDYTLNHIIKSDVESHFVFYKRKSNSTLEIDKLKCEIKMRRCVNRNIYRLLIR